MLCAQAWKPGSQHAGEKRGVAGLLLGRTMDCSPPGSSVHGTLQARVLEWGAIAFSGLSLSCRDQEGRRGSEEAVPGPSVFPSGDPGPRDCGATRAAVYGVTQSQTRLK